MITKKNGELLKKGGYIMLKKFALCILFIVVIPGTTIAQDYWVPTAGLDTSTSWVHCFAVDPSNSNIMYAGTEYHAYKSTNGGVGWSQINPPFAWVDDILINPVNQTIY